MLKELDCEIKLKDVIFYSIIIPLIFCIKYVHKIFMRFETDEYDFSVVIISISYLIMVCLYLLVFFIN
jgi:uncharacterized membrane protein